MSSPVTQLMPSVTLFLPSLPAGGKKAVAAAVGVLLRELGLSVQATLDETPEAIRFVTSGPEVLVTLHGAPLEAKRTGDCERPEYGQALDQYALRKLELHRAVISISVEDHRGRAEARHRQSLALTLRLARGLVGETGADLVLWEQTRVLYTVGEFSGLGQPSRARRPLATPRPAGAAMPHPDLTGADTALAAAVAPPDPETVDAEVLGEPEGLRRRVEDLAAPLHAEALRRETVQAGQGDTDDLFAASPAEAARSAPPARVMLVLNWFGRLFDTWLDDTGMPTVKMRIAVYLLTALAALIWLPAGIALAAYNLLRRESLKVTVPAVLILAGAQYAGLLDQLREMLRAALG